MIGLPPSWMQMPSAVSMPPEVSMKSAPPPRWLNIGSISSRQKAMVTNASGAGSPASYCDGRHWWYSSGEAGGGGVGGGGDGSTATMHTRWMSAVAPPLDEV